MIKNDRQLGTPFGLFSNTKENIEALTGLTGGETAYATDTGEDGVYDAVAEEWVWGRSGGGGDVAYQDLDGITLGDLFGSSEWEAETLYNAGAIVTVSFGTETQYWVCKTTHTSTDFESDYLYWALLSYRANLDGALPEMTYTPTVGGDWDDSLYTGQQALDELAARTRALGVLDTVRTITSSGTWTKPANLLYAIVEVVGGGGGGGGVIGAASQAACANGGGGGEYARKFILASALGSTETVTIGAAGAAGSAGNNNGGDGGATSFGAHVSANGGGGGAGGGASATVPRNGSVGGGSGGTGGTGGNLHIPGSAAIPGACWSTTNVQPSIGGNSHLSGTAKSAGAITDDEAGVAGNGYGGGGSGARSSNDANNRAGGAGAAGVVIVHEYVKG